MMNVGIFSNDSLLLSELVEAIQSELPVLAVKIYSDRGFLDSISNSELVEVIKTPEHFEDDVLIILSDFSAYEDRIRDFSGKIIDFTGTVKARNKVVPILEPIVFCFEQIDASDDAFAIINIPAAVFGKAAVDDLLNQTRDIFSFHRGDYKFFDRMVAFNYLFLNEDDENFYNYYGFLSKEIDMDFDLRMLPVSTGFVIDIFTDALPEDEKFFKEKKVQSLQEALDEDKIVYFKNDKKITLVGDYLRVIIKQILEEIK